MRIRAKQAFIFAGALLLVYRLLFAVWDYEFCGPRNAEEISLVQFQKLYHYDKISNYECYGSDAQYD
jgi:hypothetical protein